MKIIRKTLTLLFVLIIGFWLGSSDILGNTRVGSWLNSAADFFPNQMEIQKLSDSFDTLPIIKDLSPAENQKDQNEQVQTIVENNNHAEVDYKVVEQRVLIQLNKLREKQDLKPLTTNEALKTAAVIRARETEESFSHTRPDGRGPFTVFENEAVDYPYKRVGENLGMATYYKNEKEMADLLFNGWVESEGHYENMVNPQYKEIGIGVHYDGEFLYVTQIFGTPLY
ncbi:hypothetical protein AKA01nite_01580 [Alkalibacterium kapii]|uniref:SCP domain-containing protein n=2 Tax=Alkalibacterium kapii TaxID=426704 RepID=A0A511AR30_9LACT|nr:hypothetical protein AKA01nite_01580 [Alkalibacterium kapii]